MSTRGIKERMHPTVVKRANYGPKTNDEAKKIGYSFLTSVPNEKANEKSYN
mgnify:CR=1 FL=1